MNTIMKLQIERFKRLEQIARDLGRDEIHNYDSIIADSENLTDDFEMITILKKYE